MRTYCGGKKSVQTGVVVVVVVLVVLVDVDVDVLVDVDVDVEVVVVEGQTDTLVNMHTADESSLTTSRRRAKLPVALVVRASTSDTAMPLLAASIVRMSIHVAP